MHARMTVSTAQPEHFDEALAAVQEAFLPAAQEQPGYGGFLLLTDRPNRQLVGISFWETEADMRSSGGGSGYYQQRMNDFVEFLTEPPTTTTHEVAVREPGPDPETTPSRVAVRAGEGTMSGHAPSSTEDVDQAVRFQVFRRAAETARVPPPEEIAAALDLSPVEVEDALRRLAANRLLVLAPATTNVWIAQPFCAVPTDFRVRADGRTYWAICIWDALGIPAALHTDATITARCGDCGEELRLEVREAQLVRSEGIVHFAVPAIRWWENVAFA